MVGGMRNDEVTEEWVPAACALPTAEQPTRVAEFDALYRAALRRLERPCPTRLVLSLEPGPGRVEEVRDLTRRETECCSFFTFALTELDALLQLEVAVPTAHIDVLDAIVERIARVSGLPA
jgi:hypothetical protein